MELHRGGGFYCKILKIWIDVNDIMHADQFKAGGKGFIQQWFHYHILTDVQTMPRDIGSNEIVMDGKKVGVKIDSTKEKKEGDQILYESLIFVPVRIELPKNDA